MLTFWVNYPFNTSLWNQSHFEEKSINQWKPFTRRDQRPRGNKTSTFYIQQSSLYYKCTMAL